MSGFINNIRALWNHW